MSHTVPDQSLHTHQEVILPDTPKRKYRYKCEICQKPFTTNYHTQKFCNDPCKHEYPRKGKPEKKETRTKSQISMDNAKKRRKRDEKEREHTLLNRHYLSMDMSGEGK